MYLAISDRAVSAVLLREDEENAQRLTYYVSKALAGAELRYSRLEKIVFAMFVTTKKLTSYFQAHPILVLTEQPLGAVLKNPTSSGRLIKWAMMLTQFNIEYHPKTAIKGQALANFIVECMALDPKLSVANQLEEPWWTLSTDEASSKKGCGGGIVLTCPEGLKLYQVFVYSFKLTNNEAEYEALLGGLQLAKRLQAERVKARTDSRLIVRQVIGTFEAKDERMVEYKDLVAELLGTLKSFEIVQVSREENLVADMLTKLSLSALSYVSQMAKIEEVTSASINVIQINAISDQNNEWMRTCLNFE